MVQLVAAADLLGPQGLLARIVQAVHLVVVPGLQHGLAQLRQHGSGVAGVLLQQAQLGLGIAGAKGAAAVVDAQQGLAGLHGIALLHQQGGDGAAHGGIDGVLALGLHHAAGVDALGDGPHRGRDGLALFTTGRQQGNEG